MTKHQELKTKLENILKSRNSNHPDITIENLTKIAQEMVEEDTEPCIVLVQNMLRDFPECRKRLAYVLLEFKYRLEEGIGQKE